MEKASPVHYVSSQPTLSRWPSPANTREQRTSFPAREKKETLAVRRTVAKDDSHIGVRKPQPQPPSPPTSPPLASVFNSILSGNTFGGTVDINAPGVGGMGYVAALRPHQQFQLLVTSLPLYTFTTTNPSRKVLYSRESDVSSKEAERIQKSGVKVVGFDLEWKPMRGWGKEYNKVSLVQVATADEILLAQLPESSKFPSGLQALLEDPTIRKVGAGIQNDVDKLKRDWKVDVQNYLDLAFLARYHDRFWEACDFLGNNCISGAFGGTWCDGTEIHAMSTPTSARRSSDTATPSDRLASRINQELELIHDPNGQIGLPHEKIQGRMACKQAVALSRLVSRYLGRRLDKGSQLSNWAAPLSEKQIEYAANDGCSGLDVYNTLNRLIDHTPGWTKAQTIFYSLVIEYHRTSLDQTPEAGTSNKSSSTTTPDDEETVFMMEGDEAGTKAPSSSKRLLKFLQLSAHPLVSHAAPTLHRSFSDPHLGKALLAADGASKTSATEAHPLYPSPPVTPTRVALPILPLSAPKSAPASPILPARLSIPDSARRPGSRAAVEVSQPKEGSRGAKTARWPPSRKQKARGAHSVSYPDLVSYVGKQGETGPDSEKEPSPSEGTHVTPMRTTTRPSNAHYGENHPSPHPPTHYPGPVRGYNPPHGYIPPTPATPYSNQSPYDGTAYYAVPVPYPQPPPMSHAYSYPGPIPYTYAAYHGYGQHAYPHGPPQPYYYWGPESGGPGLWPINNPHSSHVPPSGPPMKRPSLRYSDGAWHNVDTPTSAAEDTKTTGEALAIPIPHGIPTPQLEATVSPDERESAQTAREPGSSNGTRDGGDEDANHLGHPSQEVSPAAADDRSSSQRTIYVGDVALQSQLCSDNVRFGSGSGSGRGESSGISFGGMGNGGAAKAPQLSPEIYA